MTREQIASLIQQKIPDNNSNEISAAFLREVLIALNESKFNLDEDTLRQQMYNQELTLEQRLQALGVEKRAVLGPYDFGNGTQSISILSDPDNIIQSASGSRISELDYTFDITFNENIVDKKVDVFRRLTNGEAANSNILSPADIFRYLDPTSSFTYRFAQTRRSSNDVGTQYLEIVLK